MTDREQSGADWPSPQLSRVRPLRGNATATSTDTSYEVEPRSPARPAHLLLLSWLSELRRRWGLASLAAAVVLLPTTAYAILAIPTYTSEGVLQVSAQGTTVNPLLDLVGAAGSGQVETEVEIVRQRDFILGVFKELRLHLIDPSQPKTLTHDFNVSLRGASPVRPMLKHAREAVQVLEVAPAHFPSVPIQFAGVDESRVRVRIGPVHSSREYEAEVGEVIVDDRLTLQLSAMPVGPGEAVDLEALSDGVLMEMLAQNLRVSPVGGVRQQTNLVTVRFTDPDRETAQAVVQTIMQRYIDQSLQWQALSASNAAEFIAQRLEEAQKSLTTQEETLRQFAEKEHAVQLDTQAEVTIESSAELEAEKRKIELQERVIGTVLSGMKRKAPGSANLTANFFEDPVLAGSVQALTEAETKHAVLRATLTDDHPQVIALGEQIRRHQKEIERLLRSAQKNLTQQRKQLDEKLEAAMTSLSAYPDKELQLARHMRDVEVSQKLYSFLLEKFQEAEILEASTTIDKRIANNAALPHRKTSPQRVKLILTGLLGGVAFAFAAVYLAHVLQRKLQTIEAIKQAIPFPIYGTVPFVAEAKNGRNGKASGKLKKKQLPDADGRLEPTAIWSDNHGGPAESFRALAVNLSLSPATPGRGRIVQVTSSQPGEGKSTITSNLAVALASSGARVILIDLDLRKPVQHRNWKIRRAPGYSDLIAQGGGPKKAQSLLQHDKTYNVDVLTAGAKLPDTLGALMGGTLESMLAYWSTQYDYVLLDSPPVFVADTAVIGRHADLILLVAHPGVIERGTARQAVESLARLDVHKGLVLNGVERKHAESYYYYGGYYYAQTYAAPSADSEDDKQAASS